MGKQIVAVMKVKKETPGKIVLEEIDGSPHLETIGMPLNIYVPKISHKNMLEPGDVYTLLLETGDQRP